MSLGLVAVCGLLVCHDLSLVGVCLRLRSMCLCLVGMRLFLTFCGRSTLGHCRRQQRGLILRERQALQEAHATGCCDRKRSDKDPRQPEEGLGKPEEDTPESG